jgi:hypothetical protein
LPPCSGQMIKTAKSRSTSKKKQRLVLFPRPKQKKAPCFSPRLQAVLTLLGLRPPGLS